MSQGYAVGSLISGLASTAFAWSSAYTTSKDRLNDGVIDSLAASAASAQASGQYLTIDLGSSQALVGFALLNHNLASGACTVEVRATDDVAWGSYVTAKAASTIVTAAPNQKDTALQFASVTKRYWRIIFVHTGTKIVTLGEVLALSAITSLSRHSVYGDGETERYVLNRNESKTGNIRSTFLAGPLRSKSLPFRDLQGTSQRDELLTMWRATKGGNSNLLWLEFIESTATAATAAAQECLWGKLEPTFTWTQDDFNLYTPSGLVLTGQGREVGS